ncbi:MAG: glycosyltransferase family 39 protein, partial [Myxococcota bacterium]
FLSPVFQIHATQVYMDAPQLFFQAAAVFAFGAFIQHGSRAAFALSLVAMGLACAVKFSSAPIVLAAGIFVLLRREPIRRRLGNALAVAVLPLVVFTAVNPYLYPDPIGRTREILRGWSEVKAQQSRDPRLAPSVVSSRLEGLALATKATVGQPHFFHPLLVWKPRPLWFDAGVGLVGLVALLGAVRRYRFELPGARSRFTAPALIALIAVWLALRVFMAAGPSLLLGAIGAFWLFGTRRGTSDRELAVYLGLSATSMWLMTGLWLPFDWNRYYLPILVLVPSFYAAGAALVLEVARTRRPRAQQDSHVQNASYAVE